mgnify:FL=1
MTIVTAELLCCLYTAVLTTSDKSFLSVNLICCHVLKISAGRAFRKSFIKPCTLTFSLNLLVISSGTIHFSEKVLSFGSFSPKIYCHERFFLRDNHWKCSKKITVACAWSFCVKLYLREVSVRIFQLQTLVWSDSQASFRCFCSFLNSLVTMRLCALYFRAAFSMTRTFH